MAATTGSKLSNTMECDRHTGFNAFPGQQIGSTETHQPGPGTFEKNGKIISSLAGPVIVKNGGKDDALPIMSVDHFARKNASRQVPMVGDEVMGKITRVNAQSAIVDIQCLGDTTLQADSQGVIRLEDVFPAEVDSQAVQMLNCYRPGDVVKARIVSLGDSRQYFLSTAEVGLGVCWTRNENGDVMLPVAWDTVESKDSKTSQNRKTSLPAHLIPGAKKQKTSK